MFYQKTLSAQILEKRPELVATINTHKEFPVFKRKLKTVMIDEEEYYILEGDLLVDEDELMVHFWEQKHKSALSGIYLTPPSHELIGIVNQNRIVRWKPGLILTYCVLKNTFRSQSNYRAIVENMKKATADWENICGVKFQHIEAQDSRSQGDLEGVIFPVREIDARGSFIASAFFPTQPRSRWKILIDHSYYTSRFDPVGILRHELGHVLGFRHEHIRSNAPAVCPDESNTPTTIPIDLTKYDPKSVMHYFCGGVGSKSLEMTEIDRQGAQKVYGLPLHNFDMIGSM